MEKTVEKYLDIAPSVAAFISLPSFPLGVDPVRLQPVVNAMLRFKLLPAQDQNFKITSMIGS